MLREAETICEAIYPLTITADRYMGVYSKGKYIAWNLDANEVPREPFEDDVSCFMFWAKNTIICGLGKTIEAAISDLYMKLKQTEATT